MEIVARIIGILDTMVSEDVIKSRIYQTAAKTNVEIDYEKTPAAVMYCVSKWAIDLKLGIVRERAAIGIGFVKRQPQLDFDGESNETIVDECKVIAVDFIRRLKADDSLQIISDSVDCTTVYDEYDTNVTGVWVSVEVKDNGGECLDTSE